MGDNPVPPEIREGVASGRHSHPGPEVDYIVRGDVAMKFDDRPTLTLNTGDPFLNPPGVVHNVAAYERYAVPGPGRVLFQAALANFNPRAATSIDFHNDDRAPLLFIAGGKDHVSPAGLNESNARRYLQSKAVTVYEEFPLRSHFTLGEEGWEQVADYALTWAIENAAVRQQPSTT